MFAAGGHVVGVVNGEIYNYRGLRQRLAALGHRFRSTSDSEVVVHGYAQWGTDVLEQLEGQFAFALWDAKHKRLILARDRVGEKPLFYAKANNGEVVFASHLRPLMLYPGVDTTVDVQALARYLVYEYVPAPLAMFRNAYKVPPGTLIEVDAGGVSPAKQYWDLPHTAEPLSQRNANIEQSGARLRDEIMRSVRERLVADVPVGVFLSGGLDSSIIAAAASQLRSGDIDTFSVAFTDPSYDESPHARRVARYIGSRHHEYTATPTELLNLIPALSDIVDEPLGDGSLIPTHLLSKFARTHVKVALGGDGGDELFAGYPTFQVEAFGGPLLDKLPRWVRRQLRAVGDGLTRRLPVSTANFSLDFKLKQLTRGIEERGEQRHQAWLASLLPEEVPRILAPDVAATIAAENLYDTIDSRLQYCRSNNRWDRLMYFYTKGYLGDGVLCKVDRASMNVGLEVRAPLLDRTIVAMACTIHPDLRARGRATKRVLKRAARGLVPHDIIHRTKHGFGMPIARWLREDLRSFVHDTLAAAHITTNGLLDPREVCRLVDEHMHGHANHRKVLWTLLVFQTWLDRIKHSCSSA